jgi:hypothetical protein
VRLIHPGVEIPARIEREIRALLGAEWRTSDGEVDRTGEYDDVHDAGMIPMILVLSAAMRGVLAKRFERTIVLPGDEW